MSKKDISDFGFDIHRKIQKHDVVLAFAGDLDVKSMNTLIGNVNEKINSLDIDTGLKKRVYHVMVECIENLYRHTTKTKVDVQDAKNPFAVFTLMKEEKNYYLTTGNYIKNADIPKLKEMIDKINTMDVEQKKKQYREILKNKTFSEKGGAGLGMIEIAIRSSGALDYEFKPIDEEHSFYIFQTKILN